MIGKPRSKAIDAVYEDTTKGADHRAQLAQEHFGISQEEANSLKITDFKGGTVEGEPANIEVMNPVSDIMKSNASTFGFNQSGLGFSQSVSEGFSPNAGARAQRQVRQIHQQISSDPRMAGTLSSDIPALETRPETGYRRRV
jgi:hypothetical protein